MNNKTSLNKKKEQYTGNILEVHNGQARKEQNPKKWKID